MGKWKLLGYIGLGITAAASAIIGAVMTDKEIAKKIDEKYTETDEENVKES